jgi:excisionase family DNA binding protein
LRRARELRSGVPVERGVVAANTTSSHPARLPFAQRLTCTIAEACEVTGLGRTKLYELIGQGQVTTTTVGRRRLVTVQSLLALVGASPLGRGEDL